MLPSVTNFYLPIQFYVLIQISLVIGFVLFIFDVKDKEQQKDTQRSKILNPYRFNTILSTICFILLFFPWVIVPFLDRFNFIELLTNLDDDSAYLFPLLSAIIFSLITNVMIDFGFVTNNEMKVENFQAFFHTTLFIMSSFVYFELRHRFNTNDDLDNTIASLIKKTISVKIGFAIYGIIVISFIQTIIVFFNKPNQFQRYVN